MQIQYVLRSYGYQTAAYSIPRVACAPVSPADSAVSPRPREEETQKKQRGRVLFGIPFVFGSKMKMKQSKNTKNFTVHSKQTISISDLPLMVLCTVYCRLGSGAFLHKNEQCYCRPSFLLPFSPFGSRLHGALLRTGVARWRGRLRTDVSVLHGTALKWRHRCGAKRALRTLL